MNGRELLHSILRHAAAGLLAGVALGIVCALVAFRVWPDFAGGDIVMAFFQTSREFREEAFAMGILFGGTLGIVFGIASALANPRAPLTAKLLTNWGLVVVLTLPLSLFGPAPALYGGTLAAVCGLIFQVVVFELRESETRHSRE